MKRLKAKIDNTISLTGRKAAAEELGCNFSEVKIASVSGGYSLNRRALVGYGDKWIFAKEVDHGVLIGDGERELEWLRKDLECNNALRQIVPEIVPEWEKLTVDGHVLLMPSYRVEDGWLWTLPLDTNEQRLYVQAVVDATKKLEAVKFSKDDIDKLSLHPYFRDKLALDGGLDLIIKNGEIRNQLECKYAAMVQDESLVDLYPAINKMQKLLKDKLALKDLSDKAMSLIDQPNNCFGHCDVRSDNIAYNPSTGYVKFVDWNWASFATTGFGATEFLIDMSRRGVDVTPWIDNLNVNMLAAAVGFYAKRCLEDPLAPGNTLRDVQAQSAAVALNLYDMVLSKRLILALY